jgi:Flp pilus assembly protein TadD
MSRLGKEQTFFVATLALTGLLGAFLFTSGSGTVAARAGKKPDPATLEPKLVASAPRGALADVAWTRDGREAFREPRDWLPLPPVDLDRPPLREPSYVPPPPRPSTGLDRLGAYRQPSKTTPHVFPDENGTSPAEETPDDAPANAAKATEKNDKSAKTPSSAKPGDATKPGDAKTPASQSDPKSGGATASAQSKPSAASKSAEVLLDEDELKRKFDWLELSTDLKPWYGVIQNEDKFGLLTERKDELVKFRRLDPKTNHVQGEGAIKRDLIKDGGIHFADTAANKTESLLRQFPEATWTATALPKMLDLVGQVLQLGREDASSFKRAADRLEKYTAVDAKAARTWEMLADAHAALLDFESELKALARAESGGVESPGLVVRRARWLRRAGARGGALARLATGAARFPNDRELRLAYGRALLERGAPADVELALQQFTQAEQASETGEQRMEVIAASGAALLEKGDVNEALNQAKRILGIDRRAPVGIRLQGASEFALGQFDDASSDFDKLLNAATSPDWEGEALLSLAIVGTRRGDFDVARTNLRRVPQLDPRLGGSAAIAEADLLATTEHLADAVAKCRDAVARSPDDAYLRYFLGRTLRRADDFEGARLELRRALDLGATFPDLFDELGYLALLEGRASDAQRYFEESLAREERDGTRLFLAHAHLLGDDLGPARALFDALQSKKPTSESLLGLAYCAYKKGESAVAQQLWTQVRDDLASAHPDDKAYAAKWLAAVLDAESKQVWEDLIPYREVGNGWDADARYGPEIHVTPGSLHVGGPQRAGLDASNMTFVRRDVELSQFCEFEVDVTVGPKQQGRVGVGLARFQMAANPKDASPIAASLLLAIDADGTVRVQHREHVDDVEWKPVGTVQPHAGDKVTITLRRKERGARQFQFFVDGAPMGPPVEMNPWSGKSKQSIHALFFASAPGGKEVDASMLRARRIEFLPTP